MMKVIKLKIIRHTVGWWKNQEETDYKSITCEWAINSKGKSRDLPQQSGFVTIDAHQDIVQNAQRIRCIQYFYGNLLLTFIVCIYIVQCLSFAFTPFSISSLLKFLILVNLKTLLLRFQIILLLFSKQFFIFSISLKNTAFILISNFTKKKSYGKLTGNTFLNRHLF